MQTLPKEFTTIVPSTAKIVQNEGIAALWKGAVPTVIGMALENAMAFGINEALKRAFPDDPNPDGNLHLAKPFAMGALTGVSSAFVLLPSEIVKAKLQVVVGKNVTTGTIVRKMITKQGYSSLLCGLDAQLARDATFYAVFFGGYDLSCYMFRTHVPIMPEEVNFFISGGLAGMLGWTVAMPFDVPKTNVQSRYDTKVIGSFVPELVGIAKARGVGALYSGLIPTLIRAFPANAALFLGVEMGKRWFDKYVWKA